MLSALAREFFAQSTVLVFPLVALCIFFAVFVVVFVKAVRTPEAAAESLARMPLEDSLTLTQTMKEASHGR